MNWKEENRIVNRDILLSLVGMFLFAFSFVIADNIFLHWTIRMLIPLSTLFFIGLVIHFLED